MLLALIACAPKAKVMPPAVYEEKDLTLSEVIEKVSSDIELLKAITDIKIEKNNEPYTFINASVLIKKPDWIHMRIYQLGMLVRDFVIRDDELYVLSGKNDQNLKPLGNELHNAIFWWDEYVHGDMHREVNTYVIKTADREIHIDRSTLLPVKQMISTLDKKISVMYENPTNSEGFWYPGLLKIMMNEFTFTVKLKKLIKNPPLGEFDFQVPAKS